MGGFDTILRELKEQHTSLNAAREYINVVWDVCNQLTKKFGNTYVPKVQECLFARLLSLSDNDIKSLDKEEVIMTLDRLEDILVLNMPKQVAYRKMECFQLNFAFDLFNCPALSSQLQGLLILNDMIDKTNEKNSWRGKSKKTAQWMTYAYLTELFTKRKVSRLNIM